METVIVAADRGLSLTDMELLVGSILMVAAFTWMTLSRMRTLRTGLRADHTPRR